MRARLVLAAAVASSLVLGACGSGLSGPQLSDLPPGFAYAPQGEMPSTSIGAHRAEDVRAWRTRDEPPAGVSVTRYGGRVARPEFDGWLEREPTRGRKRGPVRNVTIDRRVGWMWTELGTSDVLVQAVIAYEDVSYHVRMWSERPDLRDPARLEGAVASFERDPAASRRWMLLVAAGVAGALVWLAARRFKPPPPPRRVISRPRRRPDFPVNEPPGSHR